MCWLQGAAVGVGVAWVGGLVGHMQLLEAVLLTSLGRGLLCFLLCPYWFPVGVVVTFYR
jgi:hypothetical protein